MGLSIVLASIKSYKLPNVTNNDATAQDLPLCSVYTNAQCPTEQVDDRGFYVLSSVAIVSRLYDAEKPLVL